MSCDDQLCPLKRIDFSRELIFKKPMIFGKDSVLDKRLALCFETVFSLLMNGAITLFPHDNNLKINLYCYVITHMDLKEQAIGIYNFLRDARLNLYQKFLVYRYKFK